MKVKRTSFPQVRAVTGDTRTHWIVPADPNTEDDAEYTQVDERVIRGEGACLIFA